MADDDARSARFERLLTGLHAAGLDALPGPLKATHTAFVALIEFWRDDPGREGEVDAKLRELETAIDRVAASSREDSQDRAIERLRRALAEVQHIRPPARPRGPGDEELACYLDKLRSRHAAVKLIGLPGVSVPLRLDGLYVELHVMIHRELRRRRVFAAAEYAEEERQPDLEQRRIPLAQAFQQAGACGQRGLVLLGDPGAGKTTHLQQVLLHVFDRDPTTLGLPADVAPIFLPLHAVRDRQAALPELIAEIMRDPLLDLPASFAARLCTHPHLLLLFDGLDEVADAGERREVARWIQSILRAAPHSFAIVTCRYAGYTEDVALDDDFLELHLRPLTKPQMEQLVRNWYRQVLDYETARAEHAHVQAQQQADALLGVLAEHFRADQQAFAMARNPLLLTVICLVHHSVGELPRGRATLYQACIDVLLGRWKAREQKALPALAGLDIARILQPVAAWMHGERDRRQASGRELAEPLRGALAGKDLSPEAFLATIRDEAGVLTGWGIDVYGFIHLGVQEFLTAKHWRDAGGKHNADYAALASKFDESWWQEVILLMLALPDAPAFEPFMRALVEQPGFAGWARGPLFDRCFAESVETSAAPFVELIARPDPRPWWARALGVRKAVVEELAMRQVAAAQVLERHAPGELERHAGVLDMHWQPTLRQWWQARGRVLVDRAGVVHGLEFVRIEAGTYWIGSPEGVGHDDERPLHRVTLAAFELARTPVTNAQYRRYLEANPGVEPPEDWSDPQLNQPNQPVVGVSWHEAMAYCKWAGLVLPTEAQWEVACRAGSDTQYCSGDTSEHLDAVGWYGGNSGQRLHAVMEKQPNAWGLYDLHGNVWEWCLDGSTEGGNGSYGEPVREHDGLRREPGAAELRVIRGGGWNGAADWARSACRNVRRPSFHLRNLGFRPTRVIPGDFTTSPTPSR